MKPNSKVDEGNAHMQAAEKAASSGFFKKPDWDSAAASYVKAATAFKVAKEKEACAAAHRRAAGAFEASGSKFHAGKHLELAAKEAARPQEAVPLLEQAARLFRENGNGDKGAHCLAEAGARAEEAHLLDEAVRLYRAACEVLEGEDRADSRVAGALLGCLIRTGDLEAAAAQCAAQEAHWARRDNLPEAHRCANCRLVLLLARGDAVAAERACRAALAELPGYAESDAARYALELLEAVRGDGAALAALQSSAKFRYLEAPVVRLFRELRATAAPAPEGAAEEDLT